MQQRDWDKMNQHPGEVVFPPEPPNERAKMTTGAMLIGLLINSAIYVVGVMAAGIAYDKRVAVYLAITTAGLNYLAYGVQLAEAPNIVSIALVLLTVAVGLAAGLALLF